MSEIESLVVKVVEDYLNFNVYPHATSEKELPGGRTQMFFALSSDEADVEVSIVIKEKM